jgi:hypothetical protein
VQLRRRSSAEEIDSAMFELQAESMELRKSTNIAGSNHKDIARALDVAENVRKVVTAAVDVLGEKMTHTTARERWHWAYKMVSRNILYSKFKAKYK